MQNQEQTRKQLIPDLLEAFRYLLGSFSNLANNNKENKLKLISIHKSFTFTKKILLPWK